MNYDHVVNHLQSRGYDISTAEDGDMKIMRVASEIGDHVVEFVHFQEKELAALPAFFLKDPSNYGVLAHVLPFGNGGLAGVCVNDQDSVSVNFERPELAFEESIDRHIEIVKKAITDSDWNQHELLREFQANWIAICDNKERELLCTSHNGALEELTIYRPVAGAKSGFDSYFLGVSESTQELSEYSYIRLAENSSKRTTAKGKGFVIPLQTLSPAPSSADSLGQWYLEAIDNISQQDKSVFLNKYAQWRDKEFWLVFNADSPSGRVWFCLNFQATKKKTLPTTENALSGWKISAVEVRLFNKDLVMPRSGAIKALSEKSVMLIGCGSVGSEIAQKIASSGVGELTLCDPDKFTLDNLYRHTLTRHWIGAKKSNALGIDIGFKYPWIRTRGFDSKLLGLRNKKVLSSYDLIIVAIGSPTHERLFHDYLLMDQVDTPVIYTWLEGYGVGGHAILDLPSRKGCLRCAYVDLNTICRGLASNLNFFEPNQNLTVNHAGCGDLFLPYNALSSAQTAIIATNLAVKCLVGKIIESSKISWKGDSTDARDAGFYLSHRYEHFTKSLEVLPLYNEYCDICNG